MSAPAQRRDRRRSKDRDNVISNSGKFNNNHDTQEVFCRTFRHAFSELGYVTADVTEEASNQHRTARSLSCSLQQDR